MQNEASTISKSAIERMVSLSGERIYREIRKESGRCVFALARRNSQQQLSNSLFSLLEDFSTGCDMHRSNGNRDCNMGAKCPTARIYRAQQLQIDRLLSCVYCKNLSHISEERWHKSIVRVCCLVFPLPRTWQQHGLGGGRSGLLQSCTLCVQTSILPSNGWTSLSVMV